MESVYRTFELKKELIDISPSSIFTKNDVTLMVEELKQDILKLIEEENAIVAYSKELKDDVLQAFRNELDDNSQGINYIDDESAEFSIGYNNQIELQCIELNVEELEYALNRAFKKVM
jgi:hydrogenase maturation factor